MVKNSALLDRLISQRVPELCLQGPSHTVEVCGNDTILVDFLAYETGSGPPSPSTTAARAAQTAANQAVRALMGVLQSDPPSFVADQVAGVTTLAVRIHDRDQQRGTFTDFLAVIDELASACLGKAAEPGKTVVLHACFDPELSPDLDSVARVTGQTPRAVIDALLSAELHAEVVGFMPGFAYLGGLPDILSIPRRASPRPAVPAGSVAIAGGQAAVYPNPTPGGWNLLGRCPDLLFHPDRQPAVLIALGDRVRFREIDRAEFDTRWAQRFA
jgi:KipI family sensor histidine kinase inhibitor